MSRRLVQGFALGLATAAALLVPLLLSTRSAAGAQSDGGNPHGQIDLPCESCHTAAGWTPLREPLEFDHSATGFPLDRAHAAADCTECHQSLRFPNVATACADCHTDPHRGELGFDCERCHSSAGWENRNRIFDLHSATLFPLTGFHARLDCAACHREEPPFEFALTPLECYGCHAADYEATSEPDHVAAGFPTSCEECHGTNGWEEARFGGDFDHSNFFPLTAGHAGLDCAECHVDGRYAGTPTDCVACHRDDYDRTTDPNHVSAGFPTECEQCHTTARWDDAEFDHNSFYRLTGAHRQADCVECHASGRYAGTPTDCVACHRDDYDRTDDPDHARVGFPTDCEQCHTTRSWEGAEFDHDSFFELTGAHRRTDCSACHANGQYAGTPTDCFACHREDYNGTTVPNHRNAGFPTDCEECHDTQSWATGDFDHDAVFPITGRHRRLACSDCHTTGSYAGTPSDCFTCHRDDYRDSTQPDHQAAGFPTDCEQCHTTSNWKADFDHNAFFELTGAHRRADCESCHVDNRYAGTPTECFACHQTEYDNTSDPNHQDAGFSTGCQLCHDTRSWLGAELDHDLFYRLTGAHRQADCTDCHINGRYAGTPTDCYSCHRTDYDNTADPDHQAAGFPTQCEECHVTSSWEAEFDHNVFFQLTGAHRRADCTECHINGRYAGTPTDCYSCHQTEYDNTSEPDHQTAGFPTDCEECHDTRSWEGAVFDHDAFYPLVGAHQQADCTECHVGGRYAGTPTDCYSCHRTDYDNTADPGHQAAGFPTDCEECHTPVSWDADFDHNVFFRLTGAHRQADCTDCHINGRFAGTPTDCYSCHQTDYDNTDQPDHQNAGFPTDCEQCHTTSNWDADFDHDVFFQLTGAHRQADCASCHVGGQYAGTPTDCFACHQSDYNGTNDPDHQAAGFPTDCEACHNTSNWDDAVFDHDLFFPIERGNHSGLDCSECHVYPNNFGRFECIECHEHRQSEVDNEHDEVSGYQYNSMACYTCHPDGRGDD